MGTGRTAIVHGGNAIVRKHNKHFGGGIIVRGKFLAGPEGSGGVDPVTDTVDIVLMYAKMNFIIFKQRNHIIFSNLMVGFPMEIQT